MIIPIPRKSSADPDKNKKQNSNPVKFVDLLNKFISIGFKPKYIKFYDIDDNDIVHCSYNYQSNFDIFFTIYKKLIEKQHFNLSISYGNIINGLFLLNNINSFAKIEFVNKKDIKLNSYTDDNTFDDIIINKSFIKQKECYQIIGDDGKILANEEATKLGNFEHHFFDRKEVKFVLRGYKLKLLSLELL